MPFTVHIHIDVGVVFFVLNSTARTVQYRDCEDSSFVWRNSHHRCVVLRFFALEPNGHWRIVTVPLQCPDHTMHLISGAQVKMDGLHLVSPSPVGSVKVDQQKAPRGPTTDWSCSVRSFSGSNIRHQSLNKGFVNIASRWNRLPGNSSCQNSFSSSDSSVLFLRGSNATNSSSINIDISKVDKDNFSGKHPLLNSQNGILTNYPEFSNGVRDMKSEPISCFGDPYSNVFFEKNNSLVLDSVSVGSNSDEGITAACNVKISNKDGGEISPSEPPGYVASKGCFSSGNMLNGVADLYCHVEGTKYRRQGVISGSIHLVVPAKRGKQINRVVRNSSVYRLNSVGNLHRRYEKENNHSVWQKVQRNDVDECNYELKKVNSFCSQFDIGLEETPLLKKNCNVVESNILSNDGDKIWSKIKVSRKLKRKTSPGPKQEYNCYSRKGSHAIKKWIPIKTTDSALTSSACSKDDLDKSGAESSTLINIAEVELASVPCTLPSSMDARLMCSVREYFINATAAKLLVRESKDQNNSAFENGLNKIAQAVKDAYRAQLASETVHMAIVCPIAEFEKFLHSATPFICLPYNNMKSQTCSHDEVVGASMWRHETPSISLGSLWQWYEKHGSYGLEVRAEDYENSKRLGIDRFAFRAYFVPFLSAVQLFRNRKSHPPRNRNTISGTEATVAYKVDGTSENSSNVGRLPIFSILVPQPRTEYTSFLPRRNHMCYSESSSKCIKANISIQPIDSASSDDLKLLFKYFEVEQPE
ncbi:hypothetical protein F0562_033090 [Nyssa sinensis]|uniref:Uncharacterized protein n=1 Tax=Nyssa sinensis TaxID=561372 RepID=A0A5J5AVB4_9ASTE|nr:hypothetical protein F0562_033090 [Nyssa sinensis]